jgi:hypothetical protein
MTHIGSWQPSKPTPGRCVIFCRLLSPASSRGPSTGGGDSDSLFGGLGGDFAAGARSRVSFGTRFVLHQRNIENLCKDRAALREEIRKSVAELYDAALEAHARVAIKGAPEQHAEGASIPGDEDG